MSPELSSRIAILRTVLIAGLIVLHVPPHLSVPSPTSIDPGGVTFLKLLFDNVLFRSTLPALSVLSGYLLFRNYRIDRYPSLVKKKIQSLGIPLLLWNLPLVLAVYLCDRFDLLSYNFRLDLYPANLFNLIDATIGLRDQPINFPLQFLRDLLLCGFISPLLWLLLKRAPYLGLILVFCAAFILPLDGKFFARTEIALFVYLGGMWVVCGWKIEEIVDRYAELWIGAMLVGALLITWLAFDRLDAAEGVGPYVRYFRFLAILGFLAVSGILVRTAFGACLARLSRYAFWVFCTHGPLLALLWVTIGPRNASIDSLEYLSFYALSPVVAITLGVVSYELCKRLIPSLWSTLLGNRPEPRLTWVSAKGAS